MAFTIKGVRLFSKGGLFTRNGRFFGETPPPYEDAQILTESSNYLMTEDGNSLTTE